jgi:hypothetical protein
MRGGKFARIFRIQQEIVFPSFDDLAFVGVAKESQVSCFWSSEKDPELARSPAGSEAEVVLWVSDMQTNFWDLKV